MSDAVDAFRTKSDYYCLPFGRKRFSIENAFPEIKIQ